METLRINCWSGPRNVSTALMRSFSRRSDTTVVDEPLYGAYLATTRAPHPGRDELVEILETDAQKVIDQVILGPFDSNVLFLKQMVHHLTPDVDLAFLDRCVNIMLIRDPAEVISSLVNQLPEPTARDVGLDRQVELFRDLQSRGQEPPVIDARHLLLDPSTCYGICAIAWDCRGSRRCCRGRRARILPTERGPSTGTTMCRARRVSRRTVPRFRRCRLTAASCSPNAAVITMS